MNQLLHLRMGEEEDGAKRCLEEALGEDLDGFPRSRWILSAAIQVRRREHPNFNPNSHLN